MIFQYCVIDNKNILAFMDFEFDAVYPYVIIVIVLIIAMYYVTREPPFNPVPPI